MKVRLIAVTPEAEKIMQAAAAVCVNKEPNEKGMMHAIDSGHLSIAEHISFTFYVHGVSRSLLAQLMRHRIASFSVESQRYVDCGDFSYTTPESIRKCGPLHKAYMEMMEDIKGFYRAAVEEGIAKEDARYMLPNACATNLIMTMNAREILHFLSLRECNRAQWEIRKLAEEIRQICAKVSPALFEKAGAGCRRGRCPEMRPCGRPKGGERG